MADVQQAPIVAPVPTNVNVYTASGSSEPAENVSPAAAMTTPAGITVVTSGTRPLLFASSASSVDGVAESTSVPVQSTPPTPAQPTAAVTGIQINTAPSMNGGSGIVIRSAASSSPSASPATATSAPEEVVGAGQTITHPATVTISPATGSASVSSGITIRSSASPTQAAPPTAPPSTSSQPGANAGLGQSTVSSPVPIQPILINQVSQQPQQSAVTAPTPPVELHPVQTPSGGTSGSVAPPPKDEASHQPLAAASSSGKVQQDGVIRAPPATSHGRKAVAADLHHEEPAITLSELVNRLDLVTVCGFLLAVMSVAFGSILSGQELSISWLMVIVALASVVVFIRFRL